MSSHAKYAPSACYRNMKCTAAIAMCDKAEKQGKAPPVSEFALEGTRAHEWIAKFLENPTKRKDLTNELHAEDPEMCEHVLSYLDFVEIISKNFRRIFPKIDTFVEHRVDYDDTFFGTIDFCAIGQGNHKRKEAIICDFKYGRGVEVSAEHNEQLQCYAVCLQNVIQEFRLDAVHLFIFQPRTPGSPYSRFTISGRELFEFESKVLENKVACLRVLRDGPKQSDFNAGDHCRFCNGRSICPGFISLQNSTALQLVQDVPEIPDKEALTTSQKIEILKLRKSIDRFLDDIEKDLHAQALNGAKLPGLKVVKGRSTRKWSGDINVTGEALKKLGVTDPYKVSLIGIGEVEKEIGKNKIDSLVVYTEPTLQLVPESDKREAIAFEFDSLTEIDFESTSK